MDKILQKHILFQLSINRNKALSFPELIEKVYSQDIISPNPDAVKESLIFLYDKGFVLLEDINPKEPYFAMIKITETGLKEVKERYK